MEHLGRVICAILGLDRVEETLVLESISKFAPTVITDTIESFSFNFSNLFS